MNLPPYVEQACEDIDSAVFSGDLLFDAQAVVELEDYIGRWQRAIAAHRAGFEYEGG